MDAAIEEMTERLASGGPERYMDGDLRFHLAIAEITRNGAILQTMRACRRCARSVK